MICWKSILKYLDNSLKENVGDNLLSNNSLSDSLLGDKNLTYINRNINIGTKAKSNSSEDIASSNLFEKNSEINIEDLFQQVQDLTIYKRLIRKVLEQTCSFF